MNLGHWKAWHQHWLKKIFFVVGLWDIKFDCNNLFWELIFWHKWSKYLSTSKLAEFFSVEIDFQPAVDSGFQNSTGLKNIQQLDGWWNLYFINREGGGGWNFYKTDLLQIKYLLDLFFNT